MYSERIDSGKASQEFVARSNVIFLQNKLSLDGDEVAETVCNQNISSKILSHEELLKIHAQLDH